MSTVVTRWRKLPVEIEAWQFWSVEDAIAIASWCGGRVHEVAKPSDPSDVAVWIDIPTLEGVMRADCGDFVIRGVKGEFYPCKPAIFLLTYESA